MIFETSETYSRSNELHITGRCNISDTELQCDAASSCRSRELQRKQNSGNINAFETTDVPLHETVTEQDPAHRASTA